MREGKIENTCKSMSSFSRRILSASLCFKFEKKKKKKIHKKLAIVREMWL